MITREKWEAMIPGETVIVDNNGNRWNVHTQEDKDTFMIALSACPPERFTFVDDAGDGKPGIINDKKEREPTLSHPRTIITEKAA